ncbi:hypothetical protein ACA910_011006 [Epithemia clementina (nom. ined.)]
MSSNRNKNANSLEDAEASNGTSSLLISSTDATAWKDPVSPKDKDASSMGPVFSFQHTHQLTETTLVIDSRDEAEKEEEDSSSLGYSDDSASLSDVYFHPQPGDNLARPHGRLIYGNGPVNPYQAPPIDSTYGSLQNGLNGNQGVSPFWLGGPIQEDAETMLPYNYTIQGSQTSTNRKNHNVVVDPDGENTALLANQSYLAQNSNKQGTKRDRRHRSGGGSSRHHHRQLQKLHVKQREHAAAREKAVSQIRGQPQDLTSWKDFFWAVLFLAQLAVVGLCALRFGFGVILFKDHPVWGPASTLAADDGGSNDTDLDGARYLGNSPEVNASLHFLNDTLSAMDENAPKNASLKDLLFSQDDAFLKSDDFLEVEPDVEDGFFTIDYKNVLAITFFAGFYACVLSYISFGFMLILARSLILIMLIFSILVALAWGIIGLTLDPYGVISVMGFAALLSTLGYTMYSWHRIPFAATNLYTALTAMRCTADITILGLLSLVVAFGWCLLWSMAFIGIVNAFNDNDCTNKDYCRAHVNTRHIPILVLLLISFHWTTMVMKNIVRVTVASAIGTWWFNPSEIGPFCTSAVIVPLWRSLTVSLGSICMGSLIISPAQWILSFGRFCCCCMEGDVPQATSEKMTCIGHDGTSSNGKPSGFLSLLNIGDTEDGSVSGGVIADTQTTVDSPADNFAVCRRFRALVEPCHRWLRSCNRWAFTYIGMYGYSFVTAGDKALQLFETRGWVEVVEDSLIQNVLLMASVVIGGSSGVFAVVVEETDGFDFTSFHQPIITAFVIGSVLGYVLSNILLLGVVGSAVSTILVCFAAGPFDFDKNHPRLSQEMREVWSQQVWEPATTQIVNTIPSTRHPRPSGAIAPSGATFT